MSTSEVFNTNLSSSQLRKCFEDCVELYKLYSSQTGNRPVSDRDAQRMRTLHTLTLTHADDQALNALVKNVRDTGVKGNFCYMHRHKCKNFKKLKSKLHLLINTNA